MFLGEDDTEDPFEAEPAVGGGGGGPWWWHPYRAATWGGAPDVGPMGDEGGDQQRMACIAVGLATKKFPLMDRMPGWDKYSYGWHSDDGCKVCRPVRGEGMRLGVTDFLSLSSSV